MFYDYGFHWLFNWMMRWGLAGRVADLDPGVLSYPDPIFGNEVGSGFQNMVGSGSGQNNEDWNPS